MNDTDWQIERVVRVVDGDSIRVIRSRVQLLGDDPFRITDPDPDKGALIRLLWVNTPEVGKPRFYEARADLASWVGVRAAMGMPLRLTTYGREARGGRVLGDLLDSEGRSASQWLMTERNWPAYEGK